MAVKQVTMVKTIKTNQYEAQFIANGHKESVERHQQRLHVMREEIELAEAELDDLLNNGFQIVAQYESETRDFTAVTFVLHRIDPPDIPVFWRAETNNGDLHP